MTFAKVKVGVPAQGLQTFPPTPPQLPCSFSLGPCWGRMASEFLFFHPMGRWVPRGTPSLADSAFSPQTSGWYLSSSRSPRRSCLSTAGMAAPDSSTSEYPRTPCCCAGCCKCPGVVAPHAPMWKSLCRCPPTRLSACPSQGQGPHLMPALLSPPLDTSAMAPLRSSTHWAPAFLPTPLCSPPSSSRCYRATLLSMSLTQRPGTGLWLPICLPPPRRLS